MSNIPRYMRILGWVVFTLMWIPFCLMFLFMFMEGEPEAPFEDLTSPMTISFALTFALMFVAMGLIFGSSVVSWFMKRLARTRGERMTARIVNIRPTGMTVNRFYDEIHFDLELNYMGQTLQLGTDKLLPRFGAPNYQVGMSVNVMYDPGTNTIAMLD
jgi:hypothetical protein